MSVYYNEFDPGAAAWLRELMKAGMIPEGEVDERSILDVEPADVAGFRQCHFFAGIGGWPYALRLAGWPDDRPVWTGSAPCQPFSVAGAGLGRDDERHLAPHWIELVAACRPPVIFGEQVASADVFGKVAGKARTDACGTPAWAWLDDLQDRLEAAHYACGASDIPAASVGAPHIRQRTFFGAYDLRSAAGGVGDASSEPCQRDAGALPRAEAGEHGEGVSKHGRDPIGSEHAGTGIHRLEHAPGDGREQRRAEPEGRRAVGGCCVDGMADADDTGPQGRSRVPERSDQRALGPGGVADGQPAASTPHDPWRDADWLLCTDGKWRPVEPGLKPLAHGVPGRVGLLRGYGNAIVPQAAAAFVSAFVEAANL